MKFFRHIAPRRRLTTDSSASAAIEFAFVVPLFLMMLFGIVAYGSYLALVHGVQQIAAEAARASVAGLTDDERAALAKSNIDANAPSYPFITPSRLSVVSAETNAATNVFTISLNYDAAGMLVFSLPLVPMPPPVIVRSAAIQRGGY